MSISGICSPSEGSREWSNSAGKIKDLLETEVPVMGKLNCSGMDPGNTGVLWSAGGRGWPGMGKAQQALSRWGWPVWMCNWRQRNEARESDGSRAVTWGAEAQKSPPL